MRDDAADRNAELLRLESARVNRKFRMLESLRWNGAMWFIALFSAFMAIKMVEMNGPATPLPYLEWVALYVIGMLAVVVPVATWRRSKLSGALFVAGGLLLLWSLTWPFFMF